MTNSKVIAGGASISSETGRERSPLSFAQQRLWFLDQLEPGGNEYLIRVALRLTGELDVAALEEALTLLAERHEVLRTRFAAGDTGEPYPVIDPPSPVTIEIVDLAGRSRATVQEQVDAAASAPFDLTGGALLRTVLMRTAPAEAILVICLHHIVFDGWSEVIFAGELRELYTEAIGGAPATLPALPLQYGDYAERQHRWLTGERLTAQVEYWRTRLAGLQPLQLATDRPRGAARSGHGDVVTFSVPAETLVPLRAVAARSRVSLFMALLAGFQVLLSRYSGQDDIAVGTPIAGRHHADTEDLIGLFVNSLVLRTDLAGDPTFAELLGRVKETALGAYGHQDLPFERLVEELAPQRDLSRNPLFQTMLVLQTTPGSKIWKLPGLDIAHVPLQATNAQVDLTFDLTQQDDRSAKGFIYYRSDLFDRATVERMADHFRTLLDHLAAEPTAPLSQITMLTDAERRRIVEEWNDTEAPFPAGRTVHELVAGQAAARPDEPAVVCGDEVLTYRRLDSRANRLAHHLRARGVGPEVHVGVFLERGLDLVVALLAIMKAGGAYVPLDPEFPAERLAYMIEDTAAPLVVTEEGLAGRLPDRTPRLLVDAQWPEVAACPDSEPEPLAGPQDLAYVIYTSGSTGRPKGVMVEHQGVIAYLSGMQDAFPLHPGDGFLQATPLTFDVSAYEIFWPLWQGGTVVLVPGTTRLDMAHVGSLMRRHDIVGLHFVPSLMDLFVGQVDPADCTGLRYAFCSGEALQEVLVRRFADRFGGDLINLYGATEVSVDTTYWRATPDAPVLAGRPMSNQQVYVLDDSLQPVPVGAVGEVHLGGRCVGRGYLNRPELTFERFRTDPFTGGRMYKTGDLGRFTADGELDLLGRIDGQVKLRGVRIEPGEIEAVLLEHSDVAACAVVAWGDAAQDKQLVAYCVPAGDEPDVAGLRELCRQTLPPAMVPAVFMTIPALPLTPNSKVDRKRLPAPDLTDLAPAADHVAPRDEIEQAIAGIWADLLGLDRVGVHDNFFEVGGHSLRAVQLVNQVERLTGIRISLRDLFLSPTIAGIKTQLLELIDAQE
ncbi:amino acid adenylation domain-containing protein [Actinomadura sp. DC4]|uniref:amino acid adenylation domain-containing protein n=1 Tax=Actinomadura sp. DC4 TaxID=3055069 RepID=UPI0025AEFA48|nr:amino acid adenylation domain-containing protein [Actinomadura sp. DC4]MDN3356431.1 amino acid adenylation domain-containing protein [Actinomadura sp. DC4]